MVLKAITLEDIHESTRLFQEEHPGYGVFPIERSQELFITSLRDKFRKALYFARIERDAERLRIAIREEVLSLCAQSLIHAYDFIKLPLNCLKMMFLSKVEKKEQKFLTSTTEEFGGRWRMITLKTVQHISIRNVQKGGSLLKSMETKKMRGRKPKSEGSEAKEILKYWRSQRTMSG